MWPAYNRRCIAGYFNKNFLLNHSSDIAVFEKGYLHKLQRGRYTRKTLLKAGRSLKSSLLTFLYLKSMNIFILTFESVLNYRVTIKFPWDYASGIFFIRGQRSVGITWVLHRVGGFLLHILVGTVK